MSTLSNMDLTNELYLNRNDWYSSHMNNFPGSPAHSQKHFANLPESRIHGPASYGQFGLSTPMSQKPSAPFYSSETSGLKKCSDFFHSKASSPYSFNSTGPGVSHSYGSSSPLLIDQNSSVSSTLPNRTSAFSKFNLGFHSSMPFPNASMNSLTNPSDFSSRFHEASTAAIKQSSNCALASMSNSRVAPTSLNPMNSFYDRVSEYNSFTKPSYSLFKPSLPPCNFSGSLSSGSSSEGSSSGSPPQLYNPHNLHQIDPQLTIDLNQSTSGLGDEADDSAYSIKNEDGDETQSLQDAQYEWMRRSQHAFASQPGKNNSFFFVFLNSRTRV